ncbi:phage integrase N-terminal SAM-like domain-containing protein [Colwellia sp. UCD-KL20]|uniref:phage integrase N-terminal SAM-like domain-containing protein n=1 Tax=Colwellia sp. UCD-KL20 TaxID=1917165 RepID=UPI001177F4E9
MKRLCQKSHRTYLYWIKAYINYNQKTHRINLHDREVEAFLSYLSNQINTGY